LGTGKSPLVYIYIYIYIDLYTVKKVVS
jgi:hypothetical protein